MSTGNTNRSQPHGCVQCVRRPCDPDPNHAMATMMRKMRKMKATQQTKQTHRRQPREKRKAEAPEGRFPHTAVREERTQPHPTQPQDDSMCGRPTPPSDPTRTRMHTRRLSARLVGPAPVQVPQLETHAGRFPGSVSFTSSRVFLCACSTSKLERKSVKTIPSSLHCSSRPRRPPQPKGPWAERRTLEQQAAHAQRPCHRPPLGQAARRNAAARSPSCSWWAIGTHSDCTAPKLEGRHGEPCRQASSGQAATRTLHLATARPLRCG